MVLNAPFLDSKIEFTYSILTQTVTANSDDVLLSKSSELSANHTISTIPFQKPINPIQLIYAISILLINLLLNKENLLN